MDSAPDPADRDDEPIESSSSPVQQPTLVTPAGTASSATPLAKWLLIYSALRFGLLVVLAAVLSLVMPLILALLFAIMLALPLSWVLFSGARRRVNEAMAFSTAHRRAERERLRSALNGQDL